MSIEWSFAKKGVEYLGHVIKTGQLELQSPKIATVYGMRLPTSKAELKSFLGFAIAHRRFVPPFAKIENPFTELTKQRTPNAFVLGSEQLQAFATLKERLIHPRVLALPRNELTHHRCNWLHLNSPYSTPNKTSGKREASGRENGREISSALCS